jgi:isopenicillin N synthase-like dioxygenase
MIEIDLKKIDRALLDEAARSVGAFYLVGHGLDPSRPLEAARDFFALPRADKQALAQEKSSAFRGWSEMRTPRDCREQIHFGLDRGSGERLDGSNQFPTVLGSRFRDEILGWLDAASGVGRELLSAFGITLADDPYLLLKLIHYPSEDQIGVAPHCDFSWLTLVVQDSPGLQVRDAAGRWHEVPPRADALFVDLGELLEWHSRGRFRAAPHRVENRSGHGRLSLPLFVSPSLREAVDGSGCDLDDTEHVHRVIPPRAPVGQIRFGDAEWRRKGENRWCYACSG